MRDLHCVWAPRRYCSRQSCRVCHLFWSLDKKKLFYPLALFIINQNIKGSGMIVTDPRLADILQLYLLYVYYMERVAETRVTNNNNSVIILQTKMFKVVTVV